MVAITVILAAVIGTFVLNLGDSVQQNASAGVTFDQQSVGGSPEVTITITSIQRADGVDYQVVGGSSGDVGSSVGDSTTLSSLSSSDRIVVTATFNGEETVIQEYTVN